MEEGELPICTHLLPINSVTCQAMLSSLFRTLHYALGPPRALGWQIFILPFIRPCPEPIPRLCI